MYAAKLLVASYLKELMATKWIGPAPTKCDICQAPITHVFFDARTHANRWGNFCHSCFKHYTTGRLGVGFGQKYENKAGVWEKSV